MEIVNLGKNFAYFFFQHFIIHKENPNDNIYGKFYVEPHSGILCKADTFSNNQLIIDIANSSQRYVDELGYLCVNLYVFASKRQLSYPNEVLALRFDRFNCSFNIIKMCIAKPDFNVDPPSLNKTLKCEAGNWSITYS